MFSRFHSIQLPCKNSIIGIIVFLSFSTSLFILSGCKQHADKEAIQQKPASEIAKLAPSKENVKTTDVLTLNIPKSIKLTGTLAADEISNIAARQGGIVSEVHFERGDQVKKGQILLQFDPVIAQNSLDQAKTRAREIMVRLGLKSLDEQFSPLNQPDVKSNKALMDFAKRDFERDKALIEKKVVAPGEFDVTRKQFATAQENYELAISQANQLYQTLLTSQMAIKIAQQVVNDLTVKSPYDGIITERTASVGQSVRDMESIGGIAKIDPIRIRLAIPEQAVQYIKEDQIIDYSVISYPNETFKGTIKNISPVIDSNTRTLTAEAFSANPENRLKPGLFCIANLNLGEIQHVTLVPKTAIKRTNDSARIFVLRNGIAVEEMVVVSDEQTSGLLQITGNVKPNEKVVLNATDVSDGMQIQ